MNFTFISALTPAVASTGVFSRTLGEVKTNGSLDTECGCITNSSDRAKLAAFATHGFYTGTRLRVKAGSPTQNHADLAGKQVVPTTCTTSDRTMRGFHEEEKPDLERMHEKWPQSAIPPKGVNLNAPTGQELIDNLRLKSGHPAT